MDTPILPQDFRVFLKLLNSRRIEYLLIGGYAVGYYGYPRATADMDIWIAVSKENARKVTEAIKDFGMNAPALSEGIFLEPGKIIRMGYPPIRIEVLTEISGVNFKRCYARRKEIKIDGIKVKMISLGDLLKNKKASGRHKDLNDLENLR
jgi:predicted nucleotidyltransferase